jgi:hypothetical protein
MGATAAGLANSNGGGNEHRLAPRPPVSSSQTIRELGCFNRRGAEERPVSPRRRRETGEGADESKTRAAQHPSYGQVPTRESTLAVAAGLPSHCRPASCVLAGRKEKRGRRIHYFSGRLPLFTARVCNPILCASICRLQQGTVGVQFRHQISQGTLSEAGHPSPCISVATKP